MKTVLGLEAEAGSWPFGWEILGYRVTREGLEGGMTLALDGHNPSVPEFLVLCKDLQLEDVQRDSLKPQAQRTEAPLAYTCVCVYVYMCVCQPLLPMYFLKIQKI